MDIFRLAQELINPPLSDTDQRIISTLTSIHDSLNTHKSSLYTHKSADELRKIEETLLALILRADNLETENEQVRNQRRGVIKSIQEELNFVDAARERRRNQESSVSSTARQSSPYAARSPRAEERLPSENFKDHVPIGNTYFAQSYQCHLNGYSGKISVKILQKYSPDIKTSFLREWRKLRDLQHENLVKLVGYVLEDSSQNPLIGIASEWMETSLEKYMNSTHLSIVEALSIGKQIASALQYLHQNDIVHGNLDPSNVMVRRVFDADSGTQTLQAKLTDVGFLGTRQRIRASSDSGHKSLRYTAPECMQGRASSAASDVYAFSLVLNSMLTNQRPFDDIANEALPLRVTLKNVRPTLTTDSGLEPIIRSGWHADPEKRPQMSDVASLLESYVQICEIRDKILRKSGG